MDAFICRCQVKVSQLLKIHLHISEAVSSRPWLGANVLLFIKKAVTTKDTLLCMFLGSDDPMDNTCELLEQFLSVSVDSAQLRVSQSVAVLTSCGCIQTSDEPF